MDKRIKHGHSIGGKATREYNTWKSMMDRCYKTYNHNYVRYGLKGIIVCDRWHEFKNFFADMGSKPQGLSLDRINNDGNYEPSNCRWATPSQQTRNRSMTVLTQEKADGIRLLYKVLNITQQELGLIYNVSRHVVGTVTRNEVWRTGI